MNIENPLYKPFDADKFGAIPFDRIRTEHYLPAVEQGIELALQEVNSIVENPSTPTFENTIVALERSGAGLDRVLNVFYPLLSAHADEEMMELSMKIDPLVSDYSSAISLNEGLWKRIKAVYDRRNDFDLDKEDEMLLNETYEGFARSGALLEGANRERYKELTKRLSELTTRFGQNVLKELNTYKIYLKETDLDGLPESIIDEARHCAAQNGHEGEYLFTLAQPTYMAFMKYSARRDLREKMYRLYSGRNIEGEFSNIEIIKEISALRLELARLLGRDTFAAFRLEKSMAGTPKRVNDLLYSLADAYKEAGDKEIQELQDFARTLDGADMELQPWDYSYYANKLKQKLYAYDEEALRPYFRLERVVEGVFGLATKLYGLTFEERAELPVYHPDVKAFEVKDKDGSYLGLIYTDFFPRETKRPGAWMTDFKGQWKEKDGNDSRPHVSIVMNFTKPGPSRPSLLTPYEVGTFLHEFGHALHGLLSKGKYASLSGTNVRRDFVELPSQFNENYLTQKEFLDGFAEHYQTGESIPEEQIRRIVDSARFGAAYACMRQLCFGFLDMAWHTLTSPIENVKEFETASISEVSLLPGVDGALISPQFSHIFAGGYAAGYYSYKWAEVLDADAFSRFEQDGIFNQDTASSFRKNILERGGTENPEILYERFRGQAPTIDALLRRDGIK